METWDKHKINNWNLFLSTKYWNRNIGTHLTPFASGTGFKLLTCPYFSGSVMQLGMPVLPTTLPLPKTTNPTPLAPAVVHLTEPSKTGVNNHNSHFLGFGQRTRADAGELGLVILGSGRVVGR